MYLGVIWQNKNTACHRKCTQSQNWANFGLACVPEKGRGFVTVRAVTANLVSKDARDFKEKSNETARRDLLALRTYRAKCLGGPPPAFLGLEWNWVGHWGDWPLCKWKSSFHVLRWVTVTGISKQYCFCTCCCLYFLGTFWSCVTWCLRCSVEWTSSPGPSSRPVTTSWTPSPRLLSTVRPHPQLGWWVTLQQGLVQLYSNYIPVTLQSGSQVMTRGLILSPQFSAIRKTE